MVDETAATVFSSSEDKENFVASLEDEFGEDGEFSYLGPLGKSSQESNESSKNKNNNTAASIGIGVTIGLVIAIVFIGFFLYRNKTKGGNSNSNKKRSSLAGQDDDELENHEHPSTRKKHSANEDDEERAFNNTIRTTRFQQHYGKGNVVVDNLTAESLTHVEVDDYPENDDHDNDGGGHHHHHHHVDVDFDVDEYSLDQSSLGTSMTPDIPFQRSHRNKQRKSYRSGSAYSSWSSRWGGGGSGRSISPNRSKHKQHRSRCPSQDSADLESQGDSSSVAFSYTEVGASPSFGDSTIPSVASKGKFSSHKKNHHHRRNNSGLSQDSYEGDEQHHGAYRINFDLLMEDLNEDKELEDDDNSVRDNNNNNSNNNNNDATTNNNRYSERGNVEENGVECTLMPSPTTISKFRRVYSTGQQQQQQQQESSTPSSISPPRSSPHNKNNISTTSTIPTVSTTPTRNSRNNRSPNDSLNSSIMTNNSSMLLSTSRYTIMTSPSEGEIPFDEITNKKPQNNYNYNNNSPATAQNNKQKKRITPPVPSDKLLTMPLPRVPSEKSAGTAEDNDSLGGDDIVQDLSDFLRERRRAKQNARSRSILDASAH